MTSGSLSFRSLIGIGSIYMLLI